MVFVPLAMLQDDLEYGDQAVSSIDLDLADPAAAPQVAAELRKVAGPRRSQGGGLAGLNARFVGALQVERVMMFIILTLIVLVAAMNVVASFTMLVRVKRGSIAILRTMGASPRTIVRAFFMSAAAVGLVGTTVGTALGLLVCANMPSIGRCWPDHRGGGQRLGRGRFHHLHAGAGAAGRGGVGHRRGDRAVAGGGRLSGLAQHTGRTGRGIAT